MTPAAISCRVALDSPGLPHLSGRATSARTEHTGGSPHGQSKASSERVCDLSSKCEGSCRDAFTLRVPTPSVGHTWNVPKGKDEPPDPSAETTATIASCTSRCHIRRQKFQGASAGDLRRRRCFPLRDVGFVRGEHEELFARLKKSSGHVMRPSVDQARPVFIRQFSRGPAAH